MTALVAPRLGQLMEKGRANKAARVAENVYERAYYEGVQQGYSIAFGSGDPVQFHEARGTLFAGPYTLEDAALRVEMIGRTFSHDRRVCYFDACGVLLGFKEATAERGDAEECSACSGRVLTDPEGEPFTPHAMSLHCRYHGWFCDEDCKRTVCSPTNLNCWEA